MIDGESQYQSAKNYAEKMWQEVQQAAEYELRSVIQGGGSKADFEKRLEGMRQYSTDSDYQAALDRAAAKVRGETPAQGKTTAQAYEDTKNVENFGTTLQQKWDALPPEQRTPAAFQKIYSDLANDPQLDRDGNKEVDDPSQRKALKAAGLKFELNLTAHTPEEKKALLDKYLGDDKEAWQLAAQDGTVSRAISETLKVGNPQETLQKLKGLLTPEQMVQVMQDGPHPEKAGPYDKYLGLPTDPASYVTTPAGKSSTVHFNRDTNRWEDSATRMYWDADNKRWVHDLTKEEKGNTYKKGYKPVPQYYDPATGQLTLANGAKVSASEGASLDGYENWMKTHNMEAMPAPQSAEQPEPSPSPGTAPTPPVDDGTD